jgi:hypothetical protein
LLVLRDAYQGTEVGWGNPWHSIAAIYPIWLSTQFLNNTRADVSLLLPPGEFGLPEHFQLISENPPVSSLGDMCLFENILVPLGDGFLWDLAWNKDLRCNPGEGKLVTEFAEMFMQSLDIQIGDTSHPSINTLQVCLMHRGPGMRGLGNEVDVIGSLTKCEADSQVLSVRVFSFTSADPVRDQMVQVHQCDIILGVHGAGLTHLLWLHEGSAVVEILPARKDDVAPYMYFKNLAMLTGSPYYMVKGTHNEANLENPSSVNADIEELQQAVVDIGMKPHRFSNVSCDHMQAHR